MKKLVLGVFLVGALASSAMGAAVCAGQTAVSGTLTTGSHDQTLGPICSIGAFTFSDFYVFGANISPGTEVNFSLTLNQPTPGTLELDYTPNLSGSGYTNDIQVSFVISPGVLSETLVAGPGANVTEFICATGDNPAPGPNGPACANKLSLNANWQASNGGSSVSGVTFAANDFVFKDISGGSEVQQIINVVPEPITFSLMGVGLLGLGLLGRRIRK